MSRLARSGPSPRNRSCAAATSAGAMVLVFFVGGCARDAVAPTSEPARVLQPAPLAVEAPLVSVAALLDSFSIGGVYMVLPRGEYAGGGSYARSPERELYAGTIALHPTGLVLPVGLPVRILAEGHGESRSTAAFQQDYCSVPWHATDPLCGIASFTYTVHGLAAGPGVLHPFEPGTGLALAWSRTAGYYDRFYGLFPSAEFFRGRVPAADTATVRELHFRRNGCCFIIPWGTTTAWETYEGRWRFGAVPADGGQAERGVAAVLRLQGPRTDAPMTAPADFTVATTTGDSIAATRWWYVRAANNVFDGEPVPLVTITQPWTMQFPRYPDAQRAVFEDLPECEGRATCTYQASTAGAVVVQSTLADGRVLAARNQGTHEAVETLELELKDSLGQPLSVSAVPPSITPSSLVGGSGLNCRIQGAVVDSRREFTVSASRVRNGIRSPAAGLTIALKLSHDGTNDGGHRHEAGRPIGSFFPDRTSIFREVTTSGDGTAGLTYFSPVASGRVTVEATANGVTVREHLRVAIAGLVELPSGNPNYNRVGATSVHPSSFHGRPALLRALTEAARLFKLENGVSLGINDMSLAEGGVFDLSRDWRKPHCGHRYGVNADIQTRTLSNEQRRSLLTIWANLGGHVLLEGNHYHFSVTR